MEKDLVKRMKTMSNISLVSFARGSNLLEATICSGQKELQSSPLVWSSVLSNKN